MVHTPGRKVGETVIEWEARMADLQARGVERYWEGRWRDEKAENDQLRVDVLAASKIIAELMTECAELKAKLDKKAEHGS